MACVFGPIPSRRLGRSLGVDPVPLKTCNWNCVYCQLGRTRPLTNERRVYVPLPVLLNEVDQALAARAPGEIDWVTIVGSGEPTLHSEIGDLIRAIKVRTTIPVAVITNGALIYLPEVRGALCAADAVLPTFSAGSAAVYRALHRPHPETTFERLLAGLIAFRAGYRGNLWVEVMLVRGVNDSEEALRDIAAVLQRVQPDRIDITLPERPPAEPWVEPPDAEGLMRATAILGAAAHIVHPAEGSFDLRGYASPVEAILAIIARHPMRVEELERAVARWAPDQVRQALQTLESSGAAQVIERYGTRFWCAADAFYPSTASVPRKAMTTSYGCR
ncbi:MAG: radical SAM protein [Roseiflexus castenholzii]|uniref:radical SAM protein n=1 Tax=Roseiflexus castenholzii TaxID=120962 RepID=UPI000CB7906E|nr:MAG: radical SAM protein [Roseiflexus castenholzii]